MEVTVLDAQNTPKKPVIAIRVGSALRHTELALNTPFHVPSRGLEDRKVKVSLYEQLGTQTIPDADVSESVCNVPVRTPDGTCTQVTLRIRRGQTSTSLAEAKRSQVGVEAYLNTHQLEARLQGLFETVLKKQPQDPYRCMIEELQKARSPGEEPAASTDASAAPVPKAPSEPKPEGKARPSPAGKKNVKPGDSDKNPKEDADTKAALAQFMNPDAGGQESKALNGAAPEAEKANCSQSMAHEIMRHCLRKSAPDLPTVFSPGERAANRTAARCVIGMVLREAHARLHARSLGLNSGGGSGGGWNAGPVSASSVENKNLTESVLKSTFRKASTTTPSS